jgi:hypothetical protein
MPDQVKRAECLLTVTQQALFSLGGQQHLQRPKARNRIAPTGVLPTFGPPPNPPVGGGPNTSGSHDALQQGFGAVLTRRIANPFLPHVDSGFWAITAKHG